MSNMWLNAYTHNYLKNISANATKQHKKKIKFSIINWERVRKRTELDTKQNIPPIKNIEYITKWFEI